MTTEWMVSAQCRDYPPEWFELDSGKPAALLCAGCVVRRECAQWFMEPVNVSELVERVAGWCPDVEDDVVFMSGVKAAGLNLE